MQEELAARGWAGGAAWNGESQRLPPSTAKSTPAPVAATLLPHSPFRPGAALPSPEALLGRAPLVRELCSLVENRSPALVLGPRRAGKTWLLEYLKGSLGPGYTARYETLQGKALVSADDLALLLEPEMARDTSQGASPGERVRQRLSEEGSAPRGATGVPGAPRRVYLLDEVASLVEGDKTLFPWLRALGQRHASVVLAGTEWDWERVTRRAAEVCLGASFGNDYTPVGVGPIAEEAARQYLTEVVPGLISERLAEWVVELCGAWPFYVQVMGHALYSSAEAGNRKPFNDRGALGATMPPHRTGRAEETMTRAARKILGHTRHTRHVVPGARADRA